MKGIILAGGSGTRLCYLEKGKLHVVKLGRGYAWLDTGTHDSLLEESEFVRSIQRRQGLLIGCLEEIAYTKGFISADNLRRLAGGYEVSAYGRYLMRLIAEQDGLGTRASAGSSGE